MHMFGTNVEDPTPEGENEEVDDDNYTCYASDLQITLLRPYVCRVEWK